MIINFNCNSNEISYNQNIDLVSHEGNKNKDSIPKTTREEKLLAVCHLFQSCYRTVIPNRSPTVVSNTYYLPQGLGALNSRPIGIA